MTGEVRIGTMRFVRRHGSERLYASNYPDVALRADAERVRAWRGGGRDVHVYFNNDAGGFAVRNTQTLKAFTG